MKMMVAVCLVSAGSTRYLRGTEEAIGSESAKETEDDKKMDEVSSR
jgi:hypothetical protein